MPGLGEFELIRRFFERARPDPGRVPLGIGDDCALLDAGGPELLAVSTDMLVEGRHFLADVDPAALGHKALAVNLSDLAAMGARPLGCTLALALPVADAAWLEAFSGGLLALADAHGCALVGGDTTRGPLNLCVTVLGTVSAADALRRDGAHAGDDLWVSGAIGAAAWAVRARLDAGCWPAPGEPGPDGVDAASLAAARARLERPGPRVALGLALRGVARAAIDLSDGLVGDLGHLLDRSGAARGAALGATLESPALPIDPALSALPRDRRVALALSGGDDYELLFAADPSRRADVEAAAIRTGLTLSRIGRVDATPGIRLVEADGRTTIPNARSFDHFA
ncbi:MAG TPA: thiamine-phosphate kinase [Burkholderiaceae bacterium]|nr:thiamine-phosphate kinase [Burkholderiaceae bacterium]